jgi:hypothetical protein
LPFGAGLSPEAVGKPRHAQREFFRGEDHVGVITAKRYLGCTDEAGIFSFKPVDVGLCAPRIKADPFKNLLTGNIRCDKGGKSLLL